MTSSGSRSGSRSEAASDEALMSRYAAGDSASFERLFQRHRRPLFTFLLHSTGERAAAEDLFQEVFLRVIRGRMTYQATGKFRTWLFAIAHNAVTDGRRRAALRKTGAEDETMKDERATASAPWERERASDPASDPVAASHGSDLRGRIEAALLQLSEEQRQVFLLRERSGLEFKHIAEITGSGLATVKSRMRYALANLRERLAGDLAASTEYAHE